jgi:RHS repeat-associated protein
MGYATNYGYDAMGRLASITYPSGDSTSWTPTSRSFVKVHTPEFGIAAGHWRLTETTGTAVKETYYDALWRPILSRERDSSDSATTRYVKRTFDAAGRETFVSYPSASSNPTTGTWTAYDALGRVTSVSQDSELGLLTTTTQYLSGFTTRTTNPRGYQTTTSYQAFDEPGYDAPTSVAEPGGVTTTISRDVYGKPLSITRSGYWNSTYLSTIRRFVYDAQQRLCKRIDPESAATLMEYDAASNLAWTARSTTLTSTSACQTTSVPTYTRSTRTWDARNRLSGITHPAGTANESYSYYADNALKTASTTDGGTWTYAYNKRRLPTNETLSLGAKTFSIGYGYNGLGHVSTRTYPSALSLSFNPNALGQPRQAGSYASSATYHPNGSLAGFNYGNGLIHSRSLNTRGLPQRIRDRTSANLSRLDYSYGYDKHGNITSIVDGVNGNENRTLTYDARDRMSSATAPNIAGEEVAEYDVLDNVRRLASTPNGSGGYVQDYRYQYTPTTRRLDRIDDPQGALQWNFEHNGFGETTARADHSTNWSYQWNAAGRMTQASRTGAAQPYTPLATSLFADGFEPFETITTTETYVYDAHGHRTRSSRSDGSTRYQVYSRAGQLLYTEDTKDNQRIDYIHQGGKLIAQRSRPLYSSTATVTYHHTDAIQSATIETNTAGTQTQRTVRTPYGSPYNGIYREGPGYAGHVTDTQTNLTYMQQRYYDPVALRFLSPDPVDVSAVNGGNFNRYWYANNNPYRYVDPDGQFALNGIGAIVGAIGGGIAGGVVAAMNGGTYKHIAAGTIGGAVGGAITGASLGAGSSQGAMIAIGITGAIMGESTNQTVGNLIEHGDDFGSYTYSAISIGLAGASGPIGPYSNALVGQLGSGVLKKAEVELVSQTILLWPNYARENQNNQPQKPPPQEPLRSDEKAKRSDHDR